MVGFTCGGEHTLRSLFDPWAPDCGEQMFIPYTFWAIEHERGWVLIDCGPHPELAESPEARLGAQAEMSDVRVRGDDDVAARLATIGVDPAEVTDVIATHLHYDHCGGLGLLPMATVHVQRAELDFAAAPPEYQAAAYTPDDWASVERWAVHDGEHDLFGDGSIVMIPTPGHTPGHMSVLVRLPEATVICVVDAAYHPEKMAERKLPGYLWNPDALLAGWERLERLQAETDAHLTFSHHPLVEPGTQATWLEPRPA
jgi:glyoxylase-like metal-dependent hydrolase (beta-lactamase superfamily II)